ncbi:hypothetical protein [Bremerella sp.]|uniref:immunity protein Imm33 domain-containing protein n=1 Tax=Bremerella sp. TaxID=2795602 RepID=UPI00391CA857
MSDSIEESQRRICTIFDAQYTPVGPGRIGIALQTLDQLPFRGVRVAPVGNMCGWWIHAGEWSDDPHFYQPMCQEHIEETCQWILPFLKLPIGWQFYTDGKGNIDAWKQDPVGSDEQ